MNEVLKTMRHSKRSRTPKPETSDFLLNTSLTLKLGQNLSAEELTQKREKRGIHVSVEFTKTLTTTDVNVVRSTIK